MQKKNYVKPLARIYSLQDESPLMAGTTTTLRFNSTQGSGGQGVFDELNYADSDEDLDGID